MPAGVCCRRAAVKHVARCHLQARSAMRASGVANRHQRQLQPAKTRPKLPITRLHYCVYPPEPWVYYLCRCSRSSSQHHLQYKDLICSLRDDIWLQQDTRDVLICSTEPGMNLSIPKCVVSPCLRNTNSGPAGHDKPSATSPSLAYLVVIQGREGALRSKLLILSSVQDVGSEMFYHAANGWSAVFSGAILRSDLKKLGGLSASRLSSIRLERVGRVDELGQVSIFDADLDQVSIPSGDRIPIWC